MGGGGGRNPIFFYLAIKNSPGGSWGPSLAGSKSFRGEVFSPYMRRAFSARFPESPPTVAFSWAGRPKVKHSDHGHR